MSNDSENQFEFTILYKFDKLDRVPSDDEKPHPQPIEDTLFACFDHLSKEFPDENGIVLRRLKEDSTRYILSWDFIPKEDGESKEEFIKSTLFNCFKILCQQFPEDEGLVVRREREDSTRFILLWGLKSEDDESDDESIEPIEDDESDDGEDLTMWYESGYESPDSDDSDFE
jgi:hypothetical protein